MTDELEMRRRRAAYRACHRGTKEMDFILGRFAEAHLPGMTGEALDEFERFIAMPDPVLTQWFSLGAAPEEPAFVTLIAGLRTFHGLARGKST
jgi:antitoxin CptB